MIQNTTEWYNLRQQELLGLLDQTLKLDLDEQPRAELTPIHKKCKENQFEIVLSGEFQGGKSTTFNALCDGRDLSPRGLGGGGVKTSAAIISAQNISDGETRDGLSEWAEITYKSAYDIAYQLYDLVRMPLRADENFRRYLQQKYSLTAGQLEEVFIDQAVFASKIDLGDATCRQALQKVVDALWQDEDIKNDETKRDQLHITTLLVKFYGTPAHTALVNKTVFGIYDYQKLVAFPSSWSQRWTSGQKNANFTFDESAFVFIGRALLRIKSESLGRIGCRITDCPGLFANDYDTKIAMKAIGNADAVWYLVNGEKQIGQGDLKSLDEIKKFFPDPKKLIISVNLKGKHKQLLEKVFPETKATLEDKKFTQHIFPYNARLAFLAEQGKHILNAGGLSEYEKKCLLADAEVYDITSGDVKAIWGGMIHEFGHDIRVSDVENVDELTAENAQVVRNASYLEDILGYLENEMITSKAQSILIDHGSAKAVIALEAYEGKLKSIEETAEMERVEKWTISKEREAKLQTFIRHAEDLIKKSNIVCKKDVYAKNMARELLEQLTSDAVCVKYSRLYARSIVKRKKLIYSPFTDKKYSDFVREDCKAELNRFVNNVYCQTIIGWRNGRGENWNMYRKELRNLFNTITEKWEEFASSDECFKNISMMLPLEEDVREQLEQMQNNEDCVKDQMKVIDEYDTNIFMLLFRNTIDLITSLWTTDEEKKAEQRSLEKMVYEKIKPDLSKIIKAWNNDEKVKENFIKAFNDVQANVFGKMNHELASIVTRYRTQQIDPAMDAYKESKEKRQTIAKNNRKIRVEQIAPIRQRIQEFEAQVKRELANG